MCMYACMCTPAQFCLAGIGAQRRCLWLSGYWNDAPQLLRHLLAAEATAFNTAMSSCVGFSMAALLDSHTSRRLRLQTFLTDFLTECVPWCCHRDVRRLS